MLLEFGLVDLSGRGRGARRRLRRQPKARTKQARVVFAAAPFAAFREGFADLGLRGLR